MELVCFSTKPDLTIRVRKAISEMIQDTEVGQMCNIIIYQVTFLRMKIYPRCIGLKVAHSPST